MNRSRKKIDSSARITPANNTTPANTIITSTTTTPNVIIEMNEPRSDLNNVGGAPHLINAPVKTAETKRKLRDFYNRIHNTTYRNIDQIRRAIGAETNQEAYDSLTLPYNDYILEERRKAKLANQKVYFTAEVQLRTTQFKDEWQTLSPPKVEDSVRRFSSVGKRSEIPQMIRANFDVEDSYHRVEVLDYSISYHRDKKAMTDIYRRFDHIPMRTGSCVLRFDWLKYADSVADTAFDETNNQCVYHQLAAFLTNPPLGRPSVFICGKRITEESLYEFVKDQVQHNREIQGEYTSEIRFVGIDEDGNDIVEMVETGFRMDYGVSVELVALICKELKRNMYVYDVSEKTIASYIQENSKMNYCPVAFYSINGHMYLLGNADAYQSIKRSRKEITLSSHIAATKKDKLETKESLPIYDEWDIDAAFNLPTGKYMTDNVYDKLVQLIERYNYVPQTKNAVAKGGIGNITSFQYKNKDKQIVVVAEDTNRHDIGIPTTELAVFLQAKGLQYNGCGIGTLSQSVIKNKIEDDDSLFMKCEYASSFNKIIWENVVGSPYFNTVQFVYSKKDDLALMFGGAYQTFKIDIKRQRKNGTLTNKYKWGVFTAMDEVKPYNGKPVEGALYLVKTDRFEPPFKGTRWYGFPIVNIGLEDQLISADDILMQIIPSITLPANYFVNHVNDIMNAFEGNSKLQKLAVNSFIGTLARRTQSHTKTELYTDLQTAVQRAFDIGKNARMGETTVLSNGTRIYEVVETTEFVAEATTYPIYKHILENEAVELYLLSKKIEQRGGIPIEYNTDAVLYMATEEIVLNDKWSEEIGAKYHSEEPRFLKYSHTSKCIYDPNYPYSLQSMQWDVIPDKFNSFEEMREFGSGWIDSRKSLFISGKAGTGKTTLLNFILDDIVKKGLKAIALAPTNKARNLLKFKNKYTVDSFYYRFAGRDAIKGLTAYDYIIIDEVSMLRSEFYGFFSTLQRSVPTLRFIFCGEFAQLPPVGDVWKGDYYKSTVLKELCGCNHLLLSQCRRADSRLDIAMRSALEKNDISAFKFKGLTYKNLAYTNDTRKIVNSILNERFIREKQCDWITIAEDKYREKSQQYKLGVGMPVICCKNSRELDVYNNETYDVLQIKNDTIIIGDGEETREIPSAVFYKTFNLGFCITIHSSQGDTFNVPYTIWDWNHPMMGRAAKYVAISRATCIENVQISELELQ